MANVERTAEAPASMKLRHNGRGIAKKRSDVATRFGLLVQLKRTRSSYLHPSGRERRQGVQARSTLLETCLPDMLLPLVCPLR